MVCHFYNFLITKTNTVIEENLENLDKQQEENKNHKGFHVSEITIDDIQVYFYLSLFSMCIYFNNNNKKILEC